VRVGVERQCRTHGDIMASASLMPWRHYWVRWESGAIFKITRSLPMGWP